MPIAIGAMTADWHLKQQNWMKYPTLVGDSFRSAKFIVDYCRSKRLDLYVLGDLLDKRDPDAKTVGFLSDLVDGMAEDELDFAALQGQHELSRDRAWVTINKNAKHIHKVQDLLYLAGITELHYYGLDYTPPDLLQAELKAIPKGTDVFFCHQVWAERMVGLRNEANPADAAFADIPKVPMVISGDYHAHKITKHKCKDGHTITAVSPGSIFMKTLDEDPHKFFYILNNDLSLTSVEIPTRPVWRSRIGTDDALAKYLDQLVAQCPEVDDLDPDKPIWHIEYRDSLADLAARFDTAAKKRAHLFLRPLGIKEGEADDTAIEVVDENELSGISGYLSECCKPETPVYNTALRILKSNNRKEELQKIVDEAVAAGDTW